MSSILDALRKVEADERRKPVRLPPPQPRSRGRLAALVAAAAFVAGAAIVTVVVALRPGALPEPVLEPDAEVASAPAAAPVAPPAAAAPAEPVAPPPAAEPVPPVVPTPPAAVAAPPAAPEAIARAPVAQLPSDDAAADADSDVPDPITILRPAPQPEPQAEVQVEELPPPAPPAPMVDVLPGPPAGAPEIHVSFLIYSSVPERRQVSLTVDNGPLLTLHEGQKAGSISLVRILRDRIHVEHGGRTFSVRAVL